MITKPDSRSFDENNKKKYLRHSYETDELLAEFNKEFDAFMNNRRIPEEDELEFIKGEN